MSKYRSVASVLAGGAMILAIATWSGPGGAKADPSEATIWTLFLETQTISEEQKLQVRPILESNAKARLAIWNDIGVAWGQMPTLTQMQQAGPEMRKAVAATDIELAKILSDTQMREFVRIRDDLRDKMRSQAYLLDKK